MSEESRAATQKDDAQAAFDEADSIVSPTAQFSRLPLWPSISPSGESVRPRLMAASASQEKPVTDVSIGVGAEADTTSLATSQREDVPVPLVQGSVGTRAIAAALLSEQGNASVGKSTGPPQRIPRFEEESSPEASKGQVSATADKASAYVPPSAGFTRSSGMLSTVKNGSDAPFHALLVSGVGQNFSSASLAIPVAVPIAGAGVIIRPARQQVLRAAVSTTLEPGAIIPAKVSARATSTFVLVDQPMGATQQEASGSEIERGAKTNSFRIVIGEPAQPTTSRVGDLISSVAEMSAPAAQAHADSNLAGIAIERMQAFPSVRAAVQGSVMRAGVRTHEAGNAGGWIAGLPEAKPTALTGSSRQTKGAQLADLTGSATPAITIATAGFQLPVAEPATVNGTSSRAISEEMRSRVPSPAAIAVEPSQTRAGDQGSNSATQQAPVYPSRPESSLGSMMNFATKTQADASAGNQAPSQQQATPVQAILAHQDSLPSLGASAIDRLDPLPRFEPGAPVSDQQLGDASPAIASGASGKAMLDQAAVSIPSPTPDSVAPAQRPVSYSGSINETTRNETPRMTGSTTEVDVPTREGMIRDEKTIDDRVSASLSSGSTVSSSPPWIPAQTTVSGGTFNGSFAQTPQNRPSESNLTSPAPTMDSEIEKKSPGANRQAAALLPAIPGNAITMEYVPVSAGDAETTSTRQSLNGQDNAAAADSEISDSAVAGVNVHASPAALGAGPQDSPARPVTDHSTSETIASPAKPVKPVAAIVPAIRQPDIATASRATANNPSSTAIAATQEETVPQPALPTPAAAATNASGGQQLGNAGKKDAPIAASASNPIRANTTESATNKAADAQGKSGDVSQHSVASSVQTSPSAQVASAHAAEPAPKPADASAPQPQTVAVQAGVPGTPTQHSTAAAPDAAWRGVSQQQVPASTHAESSETVAASSINTAKLMQTMSETEMHVGMHSAEFGDISIRTSISQQQLVAQISLDHSDLSQAISAHVSTMQTKLGEDSGLHTSIEVHNLGSSPSGEQGQSSPREQRGFTPSTGMDSAEPPAEENIGVSMGVLAAAANGNRLDIRA